MNLEHTIFLLPLMLLAFVRAFDADDVSDSIRNDLQLELVQVVYRHGDRNPVRPYPNDPYKDEKYWPEGFGQLTKIGKMEQYQLGQYLRKRYKTFLSDTYSPHEILVQSSNVDRAISSALSNLAGLYPPNSATLWKENLKWQPIPVHSLSDVVDNTLNMAAPCPRYDELQKEFFRTSEELHKINEDNKELYQMLTRYSGETIANPKDVDYINDVLFIEQLKNFTLPPWTEEILPKYKPNLTALSAFSFKMKTYTPAMQKLEGGPLLKEIIQHIKNKTSSGADELRKMFMYSGHDTTVSALLSVLDIFDVHSPPYVAMIIVDLYSNKSAGSGEYFIEISYRNNTNQPPMIMTVPGCLSLCPLGQFLEITKSRIPDNWEQDCKASKQLFDVIGIVVAGTITLLTLGLFICLGMLIMSYLRNKRRGGSKPPVYPYLHLQMEDGDDCG